MRRTHDAQREPLLRLKDTIAAFVSNEEQTTQDLHDTLEAYYKVARKRFVDAVCLQAVDYFLISNTSLEQLAVARCVDYIYRAL